jgi:hypothetical protein
MPTHDTCGRTRYQSALEPRRGVAYPQRDLSERLEVKASRGLADVRRAKLHGAERRRLRSASANASWRRFLE